MCSYRHDPSELTSYPPYGSGTLRKKSLSLGRNLAGSVGGLLPGAVSGMWDPQRDFAFLKVPTSGVKSVVALSGCVPIVPSARSAPARLTARAPAQLLTASDGRHL